jgi:hypothetical protein
VADIPCRLHSVARLCLVRQFLTAVRDCRIRDGPSALRRVPTNFSRACPSWDFERSHRSEDSSPSPRIVGSDVTSMNRVWSVGAFGFGVGGRIPRKDKALGPSFQSGLRKSSQKVNTVSRSVVDSDIWSRFMGNHYDSARGNYSPGGARIAETPQNSQM